MANTSPTEACVYCLQPADAHEHWFPRGLGAFRGAETLLNRLCQNCNLALGRLDEELARTGWTGFSKNALGIKGRKGHRPVNPFMFRAMSAEPPTTLTMPTSRGYEILGETINDPERGTVVRPLRQLVFRTSDGTIVCLRFPKTWKAPQLRAKVHAKGLERAELLEVYLREEESPESYDLRKLLTDAIGEFHARCWYGGDEKGSVEPVRMASGLTPLYMRSLAKLAFHYFMWSSPSFSGREAQFEPVRNFIRHGEGDWSSFVTFNKKPFVAHLNDNRPTSPTHFLLADVNEKRVKVFLHLFVSTALPPSIAVTLGPSPSAIIGRWVNAHRIKYSKDLKGYDGSLIEMDVGPTRITQP